MFPAQLTGWTEAARAAAEIEARSVAESPVPDVDTGTEAELPRILSAGWLGTIAGVAACAAVGLAAWVHVNL